MEHSHIDYHLGIVLVFAAIFSWMAQSNLAALGTILLACSGAAGLGVCSVLGSVLGYPMNLLSTQVLVFLSVGLAMREMFILLTPQNKNLTPSEVLQRTGPSILTNACINCSVFLIAALTSPVPALRVFCFQCAVLSVFHFAAIFFILPAFLALQTRCRKSSVPCFKNESKTAPLNKNDNVHVSIKIHSPFIKRIHVNAVKLPYHFSEGLVHHNIETEDATK